MLFVWLSFCQTLQKLVWREEQIDWAVAVPPLVSPWGEMFDEFRFAFWLKSDYDNSAPLFGLKNASIAEKHEVVGRGLLIAFWLLDSWIIDSFLFSNEALRGSKASKKLIWVTFKAFCLSFLTFLIASEGRIFPSWIKARATKVGALPRPALQWTAIFFAPVF